MDFQPSAFLAIDRRRVGPEQTKSVAQQRASALLREHGPAIGKLPIGDRAARLDEQSADTRYDVAELSSKRACDIVQFDLLAIIRKIDHKHRAAKRFQRELLRTWPAVPDMEWSIGVRADVRAGSQSGNVYCRAARHQPCPLA